MQARTRERWEAAALWIPLVLFAASLSFQRIRSWDYWWHLATGGLIAASGQVPKYDPYTFTVPGNRWVDIHWLHQLALHGLYSLGGHAAVVVGKFAAVSALVAILATIGRRRERPWVSVFALGLMLIVAGDRFMPRPELPTFVCLAAVLALLDRFSRTGDAWVYAIVGVQLVWVNVHGLFALGIAICAMYLAGEILRPVLTPGERPRLARLRRLGTVTLLAALASLANPNFLDGALYPIQQLGMIGPPEERGIFGTLIVELMPTLGGGSAAQLGGPSLGLFFALAGISFLPMALNWRRIQAADPLLWVAFLYLALGANRNVSLFAIAAAPILVRNLNEVLDARRPDPQRRPREWLRVAGVALLAATLLALGVDVVRDRWYARLGILRSFGFRPMDLMYPEGAVDWIERERPPGPIAHHMSDGGYLIWRLRPHYDVMCDGRLEVFGEQKFIELQFPSPAQFKKLDEQYHFGMVLVPYSRLHSTEVLRSLYLNSNWQLVHVDEVAVLFVRVPEAGRARYREVDIDAPDLFPPLDGERSFRDMNRRIARTAFYSAMGRDAPALALWEESFAIYPDLPNGAIMLARLLHRNGFSAAAEEMIRKLIAERPRDAELYAQAGELRFESKDLEAAAALFDQALALDPTLEQALFRRGMIDEAQGDDVNAARLYMTLLARAHPASGYAILARAKLQALATDVPGLDPL